MIGITQLNFLEKGFHRAKVTTPGSLTFAEFCATAVAGTPANIAIVMTPSNQSTAGQPMAQPLSAIITDDGGNSVDNVPVTFRVQAGGGSFQGTDSIVVLTNPDGIAETSWTLGPNTGIANNEATATFEGNLLFPATFIVSGVIPGPVEDTSVSGIVQDSTGGPIVGARAVIRGTSLEAFTGPDGKFKITNVQPGGHHVRIIGSTANNPDTGDFYPDIDFAIEAISGIDNTLDQIVILPFLDMDNAQLVGGDEDVVLTMAGVEGFAIKVFANSTFVRDPDTGDLVQVPQLMSSSQVKFDKVPMPPPQGSTPLIVGTLQPAGVTFDPPAQVTYPNAEGLAPGDVADIFAFHHDIGQFVNIGPGTVSENGSVVISDPGFGIVQSGWHCLIRLPGPVAQCANECTALLGWNIILNGSGSGLNTPIIMCSSADPALRQEAFVTVTFAPGGGSNDPAPVWSGANFVSPPTNGNSVTIKAGGPGATLLTSPLYRIPLPPAGIAGDKTCQVQIPVISVAVELTVDSSDSDSFYLNETSGVDNIATVKGTGDVILKAVLSPDTAEVRNALTWEGAIQQADKVTAKVSRTAIQKREVKAKINGSTCREGIVWVVWTEFTDFNNTGPTPPDSSVDPFPVAYGATVGTKNSMLLEVTISPTGFGSVANTIYDIKRTKERATWSQTGGIWQQDTHVGPNADDDSHNGDEDLIPSASDLIYVIDTPGFNSSTSFADEAVYKASFVEFVNIKLGGSSWLKCSNDYPWHSTIWLEDNGSGQWQRKTSEPNEIEPGSVTVGTSSTP